VATRLAAARGELERLIAALEDDRRRWEPQAAVTLERWLNDPPRKIAIAPPK
jgi:hypothetical protein